ncbi:hypothetical protein HK101_004892 [Irineochytrium annulatum]|nr:hypothetical protein HK101_004892 [Irineochytrium annulatum]
MKARMQRRGPPGSSRVQRVTPASSAADSMLYPETDGLDTFLGPDAVVVPLGKPGASPSTSLAIKGSKGAAAAQTKSLERLSEMVMDLRISSDKASEIMEASENGSSSQLTTSSQVKALLDHSKKIVVQLRGQLRLDEEAGTELRLRDDNGDLPNYEQLVTRLDDAFRNQREFNSLSARLHSVNYMINLSNYAKNRNMQKALIWGKRQVLELQHTISSLEHTVDTLNVEVDLQRGTVERLKTSLDGTRNLLENSMTEYRKELNRQAEMIKKQQLMMGDIHRNKLNQDFIVDST